MLPSRPVDWVTARPVMEKLSYRTRAGRAEADLYRPPSGGPHPGVVVCLGVVPAGAEHPQVARLGQALARSGFAALLHWSPAMRDLRLDPADVADLVSAYQTLLAQPYVDPARSGFLGTCVGGAFALLASADSRIRGRLAFVSAYAPYASMWTLVPDVASATRSLGDAREPWAVDPLTWRVYVRSLTDALPPDEAQRLRDAFGAQRQREAPVPVGNRSPLESHPDPGELSADGRAVLRLLAATDADSAEAALRMLPPAVQTRLTAMSPLGSVHQIEAPLIVLLHDRYDPVVPVGESRRLAAALSGRAGVRYTELGFRHLDPTRLSPLRLARELPRLYLAMYPLFHSAMGAANGSARPAPSRRHRLPAYQIDLYS
jgi:dienelactone hydrolase